MLFKLAQPLIFLLSYLPFRVLYGISNFLYFLLYKVLKYRVSTVRQNLLRAFPNEDKIAIKNREMHFYAHFCDLLVEGLKFFSIKDEQLKKRCYFDNTELFTKYFEQGQSVIVVMGHSGNWEWSSAAMSLTSPYQLQALYQPIKNKPLDDFVHKNRTRFGAELIPRKAALRHLIQDRNATDKATTFLTDQSPYQMDKVEWIDFFGTSTPFFNGFASIARKLKRPVLFVHVRKVKRGEYSIKTELIASKSEELSEKELVTKFANALEREIQEQPFNWLWTHKRWKRAHLKPT